jgi:hypothetical protein
MGGNENLLWKRLNECAPLVQQKQPVRDFSLRLSSPRLGELLTEHQTRTVFVTIDF